MCVTWQTHNSKSLYMNWTLGAILLIIKKALTNETFMKLLIQGNYCKMANQLGKFMKNILQRPIFNALNKVREKC